MPEKKNPSEVKKTEVKKTSERKKMKPRGGNSPVIGMNGYNLKPGDNTKILQVNMALMQMPSIDLQSVEEVENRLIEYFALYAQADMKPTVVGMAIALNGHSRQWLWAVTHDVSPGGNGYLAPLPTLVVNSIKKAYFMLENQWETYMNSGKVNPVAGIFLGKNNYGYQDKTEHVIAPKQQADDYSAEEIRKRYQIAEGDSEE